VSKFDGVIQRPRLCRNPIRRADQRMLIALNFSSRPASINIDSAWQVRISAAGCAASKIEGTLTLAANEAVILEQIL
jgi:hypothetical protein